MFRWLQRNKNKTKRIYSVLAEISISEVYIQDLQNKTSIMLKIHAQLKYVRSAKGRMHIKVSCPSTLDLNKQFMVMLTGLYTQIHPRLVKNRKNMSVENSREKQYQKIRKKRNYEKKINKTR